MSSSTTIENLVFEGGGTKGSAYAGCVEVLDNLGLLSPVKRVAGTSAGSITAALLACGAGSAGLKGSVNHTDFRAFIQDKGWFVKTAYRLFKHFGLHTGDPLVETLKTYIKQYTNNSELTFAQLDKLVLENPHKYKQLFVVSSNITRQKTQYFNSKLTPDLEIWKAVRASVSIPLIFEPMEINGEYYVDGGLADNFPVDIFDTKQVEKKEDGRIIYERNPATLGFYLEAQDLMEDGKKYNPPTIKIDSLKTFAEGVATFMMESANSKHLHPGDKFRTVFINDLGVSGTDFNTTKKMINKLIESGRKATQNYFDKKKQVTQFNI